MADKQQARVDLLLDISGALSKVEELRAKVASIQNAQPTSSSSGSSYIKNINEQQLSMLSAIDDAHKMAEGDERTHQSNLLTIFSQGLNNRLSLLAEYRTKREVYQDMIETSFKQSQDRMVQIALEANEKIKKGEGIFDNNPKNNPSTETKPDNSNKPSSSAPSSNNPSNSPNPKSVYDYQKAMKALEVEAAGVYNKLHNGDKLDVANKAQLVSKLEELKQKYRELNTESVNFRKEVGISETRGFYDLNNNFDYFAAKMRSKVAMMAAEWARDFAIRLPQNIMEGLAKVEDARVNFAQVMPDDFGKDQQAMNNAMNNFIDIASKYGASMEDVTESARLWGRQYKDANVVQQLVNSSTKLSITDNMSLVEVNKALESTMQQYNIRLKDTNEAYVVSNQIVDSWAKLADTAVVTASNLAQANERAAGAAHEAGISFDYLQGMIATMSAATGRAGGEVGRSIKSMILSMQTKKGREALQQLGVEIETLDKNGVKHMRNFEDVITDVMKKVKTSDKDLTPQILALSGGKFQYNNVMALLKNYDQLQKNIENSKNSRGWADTQVGLQKDTITRQLKGLTADVQKFIMTLEKSGATEYVKDLIKMLRELVKTLSFVDSANLSTLGNMIRYFIGIKAGAMVIIYLISNFIKLRQAISGLNAIIELSKTGIYTAQASVKAFSTALMTALNWIGLVVIVMYTLVTAIEAYRKKQEEANSTSFSDKVDSLDKQAYAYRDLIKAMEEHEAARQKYGQGSEQEIQAAQKEISSKEALKTVIGEEAYKRVEAAGFTITAIQKEIDKIQEEKIEKLTAAQAAISSEINATRQVLKSTQERINAYSAEIKSLQNLIAARGYVGATTLERGWNRFKYLAGETQQWVADSILGKDNGFMFSYEKQLEYNVKKQGEDALEVSGLEGKLAELEESNNTIKNQLNPDATRVGKVDTNTEKEAPTTTSPSKKGKSGKDGSSPDYAEKADRLRYQHEKNMLYYDAKIAANEYETAIKKLEQTESMEGVTAESSFDRLYLYEQRIKSLLSYQDKLTKFKDTLVAELNQKMKDNPDVAKQFGFDEKMTNEQKFRLLEINKESFQQLKTFTELSNTIGEINTKLSDNKKQIQEATNTLEKASKLSRKPEDVYERQATKLKAWYDTENYSLQGYNDPFSDMKANSNKLIYLKNLLEYQKAEYKKFNDDLINMQTFYNEKTYQQQLEKLDKVKTSVAQTESELRQAQLDSMKELKEGLADVTSQLIIDGNSWQDIWKNLWNALAKEAILALFGVQREVSLLGMIMKSFGMGGGGFSAIGSAITGGETDYLMPSGFESAGAAIVASHTGSNVGVYPKMHSGGDVTPNKVGVVPKLRDDEVLRTLQVGEEVNSVSDRRTNEIMAAVAMKAMDEKAKSPTQVVITALDSRSFAQYLSDNSDILQAVLAKNKALGR